MVLLLLGLGLGCADAPCADLDGPKVYVHWDPSVHVADARTFATIQEGLDAAQGKSAVCVAGGVYREALQVPHGSELYAASGTQVLDPGVLLQLEGDAVLAGLVLADAQTALELAPHSEVQLLDLVIRDNQAGVTGRDTELTVLRSEVSRNPQGGLLVSGQDAEVRIHGGRISGNGTPTHTFGGVWSGGSLELAQVTLRDNAGAVAADAYARGTLTVQDSRVERALAISGPRLRSDAGMEATGLDLRTPGGVALRVACDGTPAELQNLAILHTGDEPPLAFEACTPTLTHATLVHLGAPVVPTRAAATWTNSAAAGFSALDAPHLWQGTVTEAGLLRATEIDPDLRPRRDSDWVDAGEPTSLTVDLDGRPRTEGAAPDLGAWEAY